MFESDQIGGRADQFDMHDPAFFHDVELGTTVNVTGLRAMGGPPVGLGDGGEQHGGDQKNRKPGLLHGESLSDPFQGAAK